MTYVHCARVRSVRMTVACAALAFLVTACSEKGVTNAVPVTSEAAVVTDMAPATAGPISPIAAPTMIGSAPVSPLAPPAAARSMTEAAPRAATPAAAATPSPAAAATLAPAAAPQLDALRLRPSPVALGLSNPLFVTHAGDGSGRLFIVEKTGTIRLVVGGRLLERPFLNISDRITSSGYEQGLLGLAFPPDYVTRKFFFVNYTDKNGDTVISRFSATDDPDLADPGSELKVLELDQPAPNHNGGHLVFGPDGYLWIGNRGRRSGQ